MAAEAPEPPVYRSAAYAQPASQIEAAPAQYASEQPYGADDQPQQFPVEAASSSGLAITALVLGCVSIATSFIPIVNYGSFVLAIIGMIFAIAGIVATRERRKKGRGMAVAGLLLGIASIGIVIAAQSYYGMVLDQVQQRIEDGTLPVAVSVPNGTSTGIAEPGKPNGGQGEAAAPQGDYSAMKPGQTATLENGLSITVNSITPGQKALDGSAITVVNVTYVNGGSSNESFNSLDWRAEDENGVIRNMTIMSGVESLGSGSLAPSGTISGNVSFEGDIAKVYYYGSALQSDSQICWEA